MQIRKPATVAAALAPFKKVQANLAAVIDTNATARDDAREQAAAMEKRAQEAQGEVNQAQKVLAALNSILGAAE